MPEKCNSSANLLGGNGAPDEDSGRLSVAEIARRLNIGRLSVYALLEQGILPAIRLGRRWIVTRAAYDAWERTCGLQKRAGFPGATELNVDSK